MKSKYELSNSNSDDEYLLGINTRQLPFPSEYSQQSLNLRIGMNSTKQTSSLSDHILQELHQRELETLKITDQYQCLSRVRNADIMLCSRMKAFTKSYDSFRQEKVIPSKFILPKEQITREVDFQGYLQDVIIKPQTKIFKTTNINNNNIFYFNNDGEMLDSVPPGPVLSKAKCFPRAVGIVPDKRKLIQVAETVKRQRKQLNQQDIEQTIPKAKKDKQK